MRGREKIFLIKRVWFKIYEGGEQNLFKTHFLCHPNRGIRRGGDVNFDIYKIITFTKIFLILF